MFTALGQDWTCEFPFNAKRALEEKYNKGFFGVLRLIMPSGNMDMAAFDNEPQKILEALGDVRLGVIADLLTAGTGMTEEQAEKAIDELGVVSCLGIVLKAAFGEQEVVESDAPPLKPKTPTKKRNG